MQFLLRTIYLKYKCIFLIKDKVVFIQNFHKSSAGNNIDILVGPC